MASDGSDQNAEYALSKLLQMGTVTEYETRIVEARFEDELSTIAIVKPNEFTANVHVQDLEQTTRGRGDEPNLIFHKSSHVQALIQSQSHQNAIVARNSLQGCNIYEGCCQLDIQFLNLEELQDNQEEQICYYYWENCFSILNTEEAGNTKSPLSVDTFGNNGVDESETSGPETPAKEVVDNGNGSAHFLVGYGTGSEVVTGLPEEFQEGDMVDALSRVLKQKWMSSKGLSHKPIIPSRDALPLRPRGRPRGVKNRIKSVKIKVHSPGSASAGAGAILKRLRVTPSKSDFAAE
nr:polypyrimidine tract-binding protein homolog 3 [Tanacetum cinerariifolium]